METKDGWNLKKTVDGVDIFTKSFPGEDLMGTKGVTTMKTHGPYCHTIDPNPTRMLGCAYLSFSCLVSNESTAMSKYHTQESITLHSKQVEIHMEQFK